MIAIVPPLAAIAPNICSLYLDIYKYCDTVNKCLSFVYRI